MRNEGAAYITKGRELQNWYADPDFCGRIYIGQEKNYQQFQKLRLEQRMASEQTKPPNSTRKQPSTEKR